ncbi:MAG: hypothetical protein GF335_03540 [Candidatus Moranbacteria bacterium]|nr:hypothetical protein [Candidatus Moranbacteria bacterium]
MKKKILVVVGLIIFFAIFLKIFPGFIVIPSLKIKKFENNKTPILLNLDRNAANGVNCTNSIISFSVPIYYGEIKDIKEIKLTKTFYFDNGKSITILEPVNILSECIETVNLFKKADNEFNCLKEVYNSKLTNVNVFSNSKRIYNEYQLQIMKGVFLVDNSDRPFYQFQTDSVQGFQINTERAVVLEIFDLDGNEKGSIIIKNKGTQENINKIINSIKVN